MNFFETEEAPYWEQLRHQLISYKKELSATDIELKAGLSISRQPLSQFLNNKKQTLPIGRSNLVSLWHYLTDAENIAKKSHLSELAHKNRLNLRQSGYTALLMAAGYLPDSHIPLPTTTEQHSNRKKTERSWSEMQAFDQWLADHPDLDEISLDLESQLKEEVNKFRLFGKSSFSDYEIDNVYQCLAKEAEKLTNPKQEELLISLMLQVVSFSFEDISFSITDEIADLELNREFIRISKRTESEIRNSLRSAFDNIKDNKLEIPPVTKALVQVRVNESLSNQTIYFCHISDNTHLKNAFAAISSGMGYASKRNLRSSSTTVETLGANTSCLVKASSVLIDLERDEKLYKSTWIDNNTIKGVIQATLNSARDWLGDLLQEKMQVGLVNSTKALLNYDSPESYKSCCAEVNIVHTIIDKSRKALGGYQFAGIGVVVTLKDVLIRIQKIKFKYKNATFYDFFKKRVCYFECLAYWMLARAFHVQGNIQRSHRYLVDLERSKSEIQDNDLVNILYEIELTVFKFFSGDQEFLKNPDQWLKDHSDWLLRMQKYLEHDHPEYGHFQESNSVDIYAIAAEIFGRAGRLSMRFDQGSFEVMNHAIDNLLSAAHCCARIGHKKRLSHWLVNVSRTYSKIGDGSNAMKFIQLAEQIIRLSIEPDFEDELRQSVSEEYRQSVMAEVYIGYAEKSFLIDQDYDAAIQNFAKALKSSIYLGFTRIISESLYGLGKSLPAVSDAMFLMLEDDFKGLKIALESLREKVGSIDDANANNIYEKSLLKDKHDIVKFLENIDFAIGREALSQELQKQASKIWDDWHYLSHKDSEEAHPIAQMMRDNKFLVNIISNV
ncbi:hypothetical protein [[Limnothrix rosea] IAM M-220]|uniref:hypothetical protein n=1 Tax=[Limnothrix rosea] IAM M-220 TaxID=454133 RepID=UPI00095AFD90|nr:hypothetical protein [[Limnothrix rosea] IAM M-220]OKH19533.1 hypothetical protein NIES208_01640 [[Limnothrix rosea] IAM M-220]